MLQILLDDVKVIYKMAVLIDCLTLCQKIAMINKVMNQ